MKQGKTKTRKWGNTTTDGWEKQESVDIINNFNSNNSNSNSTDSEENTVPPQWIRSANGNKTSKALQNRLKLHPNILQLIIDSQCTNSKAFDENDAMTRGVNRRPNASKSKITQ